MSRPSDRQAGFTLIEVLAALVITAALVAVVLPFAGRLVERWRAGQGAVDAADAWMQAVARLSDDLAEAVPMQVGQTGQGNFVFRAGPQEVTFVRPALGDAREAALETVTYAITVDRSGSHLVRRAHAFSTGGPDGADGAGPSTAAILDAPYTFRFSAIGRDGRRQDRWTDPKTLPVRLELRVTGDDRTVPPVRRIVLPLMARQNIGSLGPL
jgi:prepilin-type N-terminal cleavage/methylation domain-containing protein